jgi:sec-independent protein translocase protein TatA
MTLPLGFIENIGPTELLLLLGIVLVLFGGKKLPELAHSLGRSLGEFKKGAAEGGKLASEKIKEISEDFKREAPEKIDSPKA